MRPAPAGCGLTAVSETAVASICPILAPSPGRLLTANPKMYLANPLSPRPDHRLGRSDRRAPHRSACLIVWHRIRADFLMPSRLDAFRRTLEVARRLGYESLGIRGFWERADGPAEGSRRLLVIRHDIDTDPGTASAMWRIERDLGMTGSWFFRLSTRDLPLMQAISESGGEVGYHYEEVATIAKERQIRTHEEALQALPAARERFRANLAELRAATGLPLRVAASHGDFVNWRLGVPNSMLLADHAFRAEVGVDLEGYDDELLEGMPFRSSDTAPPRCWRDEDPVVALTRGEPVVYVLFHPRHWRAAPLTNARDDARRLWEGARFALPRLRVSSGQDG